MVKVSPRCLHYFSASMLVKHRQTRRLHVLGPVNLRKTFRRITEVWENAETSNLEKCLLYLFPTTLKFVDFIHCVVFDLTFCCVTVKTIYRRRMYPYFNPRRVNIKRTSLKKKTSMNVDNVHNK